MKKRLKESIKTATQAIGIALAFWCAAMGFVVIISREYIPYWAAMGGLFLVGWIITLFIAYRCTRD